MSGGTTHREDVDGNGDYVFDVDTTYATDGENELIVSISYRDRWNQGRQTAVRLPVTIANPLRVDAWNQERYVVPAVADQSPVTATYQLRHAAELTATVLRGGEPIRPLADNHHQQTVVWRQGEP